MSGIDWASHQTVSSLALDSREVDRNGLWLAQGTRGHALEHFAEARDRGARGDHAEPTTQWDRDRIARLSADVPVIALPGLRRHAARSPRFFGLAAHAMRVIGVTEPMARPALRISSPRHCRHACRLRCSARSGNGFPGDLQPSTHTTLDAVNLHAMLKAVCSRMAPAGDGGGVVASRCIRTGCRCAVSRRCSPITRDHQDYHGDMQSYADAKGRACFAGLGLAVINVDDDGCKARRRGASRTYTGQWKRKASRLTALGDRYLRLREVETAPMSAGCASIRSWGTGELKSSDRQCRIAAVAGNRCGHASGGGRRTGASVLRLKAARSWWSTMRTRRMRWRRCSCLRTRDRSPGVWYVRLWGDRDAASARRWSRSCAAAGRSRGDHRRQSTLEGSAADRRGYPSAG